MIMEKVFPCASTIKWRNINNIRSIFFTMTFLLESTLPIYVGKRASLKKFYILFFFFFSNILFLCHTPFKGNIILLYNYLWHLLTLEIIPICVTFHYRAKWILKSDYWIEILICTCISSTVHTPPWSNVKWCILKFILNLIDFIHF